MKNTRLLFLFLIFLQFSCTSQHKKINGVSFVASGDSIITKHIQPVVRVNSNSVALMPFAYVRGLNSPKVNYNFQRQWFGETPKGIKQYANEFKKKNISVMLKPQIWVSRGEFTGFIEMKSEDDWKVLEKTYSEFILLFAEVAHNIDAEVFCVGTELEKFILARPNYWRNLIKEIKKIYKGKLTYAANWDEFRRVPFWSDLDYIGIDAYFPISDEKSPSVKELELGWQKHKTTINKVRTQFDKPVLFTEYGYRSVDYTAKEPWNFSRVNKGVNHDAQVNSLKVIYNQFWKEDWFAGGYVWKWFVRHDNVGGLSDNRFTPQNKPAEQTLKELYAN